jgi:hypothetical protein
METQT